MAFRYNASHRVIIVIMIIFIIIVLRTSNQRLVGIWLNNFKSQSSKTSDILKCTFI